MVIIKKYINEVTKRLPMENRADIGLELESTIYDMLSDNFSETEVYDVLETLGDPAILASKYSDKPMHLIGPKYYNLYVKLFKLIIPIAIVISLIAMIASKFSEPLQSEAVLNLVIITFAEGIYNAINIFIKLCFWLTITFVIIERADNSRGPIRFINKSKPWAAKDLLKVPYLREEQKISNVEVYVSLIWTAIWGTVYYNAHHLIGIFEQSESGLKMVTKAFNSELLMKFWPFIIILISAEIVIAIIKLVNKHWTYRLAIIVTIYEIGMVLVFTTLILNQSFFEPEFLQRLGTLFNVTAQNIDTRLSWGAVVIFIVAITISIFDSFKKAKQ